MRTWLAGFALLLASCGASRCDSVSDCPDTRYACTADHVCRDVSCTTSDDCEVGERCDDARCAVLVTCDVDGDCPETVICTGSAFPSCTSFARMCGSDGFCE